MIAEFILVKFHCYYFRVPRRGISLVEARTPTPLGKAMVSVSVYQFWEPRFFLYFLSIFFFVPSFTFSPVSNIWLKVGFLIILCFCTIVLIIFVISKNFILFSKNALT